MFFFYLFGRSVMGTIFLILFFIAGFNSLFPLIAAFLALARLCVVLSVDGVVLGVLVFWIILLLLFELAARCLIKEENEGKNIPPGRRNSVLPAARRSSLKNGRSDDILTLKWRLR